MTVIYSLPVLLTLLAVFCIQSNSNIDDINTVEPHLQAAVDHVLRVSRIARERIELFRCNANQIAELNNAELNGLIESIGETGNIEPFVDARSRIYAQKLERINQSFQSNRLLETATQQAIDKWFALLPVVTQREPLSQYYYEQMQNLGTDVLQEIVQQLDVYKTQSLDDLQQSQEYVRYLNDQAPDICENSSEFRRQLKTLLQTSAGLQRVSTDSCFNMIDISISGAADRALRLAVATQAIKA